LDGVTLDVGPPHALGARRAQGPATAVLVLDVLSELRPLAADITFPAQLCSVLLLSVTISMMNLTDDVED